MVRTSADLATTVDLLLLPVLDGRWTRISLKRVETARKALSFFLLVDLEELLTRCIAVLFSSERLVRLLPTGQLTELARAKPVPAFVFAVPSGAACVSAAPSCFRAADVPTEACLPVRWRRLEAMMTCCISARPNV